MQAKNHGSELQWNDSTEYQNIAVENGFCVKPTTA